MTGDSLSRVLLLAALLHAGVGHAQVTNITSSGLGTRITPQADGVTHDITGGHRPEGGPNLFHSFGSLSVGAGDIANFRNDTGIATSNIVGRVTGGATSNIFGTIQTTDFGSANLFLINPAGWVFGPSASLNVGGSFHVSTAHYLTLDNGEQFIASDANQAPLRSAAPIAFGFLGPTSPIVVQAFLNVLEGQPL